MANPTLLILAAGTGSRYGSQRLFDPVGPGGQTIVDYSIYDARRAGFGRIIFVVRTDTEQQIKSLVSPRIGRHLVVEYVYQELPKLLPPGFRVPVGRTKLWGTTHAILMAANLVHEPFAVINVNDFYGAASYRTLAHHLQSETTDYAMVGFVLRDTLSDFGAVARGVCRVDSKGFLENIVELKNIERERGHAITTDSEGREARLVGDEIVSMNMWGFRPQVFGQLCEQFQKFLQLNGGDRNAECYIPITVNELVVAGQARVKVLPSGDSWFGITYGEDHPRAVERIRHLIEAGCYPKVLW